MPEKLGDGFFDSHWHTVGVQHVRNTHSHRSGQCSKFVGNQWTEKTPLVSPAVLTAATAKRYNDLSWSWRLNRRSVELKDHSPYSSMCLPLTLYLITWYLQHPTHCINYLLPSVKALDYSLRKFSQSYVLPQNKLWVTKLQISSLSLTGARGVATGEYIGIYTPPPKKNQPK